MGCGGLSRRRETGEKKRKRTRKSTGVAPSTDRSTRAGLARRYRSAAAPSAAARTTRRSEEVDAAHDLQGKQADERRDEDEMDERGRPRVGEPGEHLDPEQDEGRQDDDPDGEEDDVPARRAADREELDVVGEQVEERLRHRQRRQPGQVQAGVTERSRRVRRPESHGRGCGSRGQGPRGARRASARPARVRRPWCRSRDSRPPLRLREALHHRIVARGELDDDLGLELGEPIEEGAHRNVAGEGDVVDEREAEVRSATARAPRAGLRPAPRQPRPGRGRRRCRRAAGSCASPRS